MRLDFILSQGFVQASLEVVVRTLSCGHFVFISGAAVGRDSVAIAIHKKRLQFITKEVCDAWAQAGRSDVSACSSDVPRRSRASRRIHCDEASFGAPRLDRASRWPGVVAHASARAIAGRGRANGMAQGRSERSLAAPGVD